MGISIRYAIVMAAAVAGLSGCRAFHPSDSTIWPAGPLAAAPAPPSPSEEAQRVARRPDQVSISVVRAQELKGGIALWFVLVAPESMLPFAADSEHYGRRGNWLSGILDSTFVELVADSGRIVSIHPEKRSTPGRMTVYRAALPSSEVRREGGVASWACVARVRTDEPCPPGKYRIRLRGDWDAHVVTSAATSIVVDRDWREIDIDPMPETDYRSTPRE